MPRPRPRSSSPPSRWPILRAVAAALALAGCGPAGAQFQVERPRALVAPPAISVLGAYRDGRMSLDEWDRVGPAIAAALGTASCTGAWGDRLERAAPEDYRAIDAESREGGVGPALLGRVARLAEGDALMVVRVFGRPRERRARRTQGTPGAASAPTGRRGARGFGARSSRQEPEEPAFEIGATVIAASDGALLRSIDLRYTGASREEAIQLFTDRLKAELPGATCAGWRLGR